MPIHQDNAYIVLSQDRYKRAKIKRMTSNKPSLASGEIAVKIVLNIDSALFDTYMPVVETTIEKDDIIVPDVSVAMVNQNGVVAKKVLAGMQP